MQHSRTVSLEPSIPVDEAHQDEKLHDPEDLSEMLNELRVLQPGAQLLTAFLITLPFNDGFAKIVTIEKWAFMATFVCSLISLVLLSAPAVQHRLLRPLVDRQRFKCIATKEILAGAVALSLALVLAAFLVISEVFGHVVGSGVALLLGGVIALFWWIFPWLWHGQTSRRDNG